MGESDSKDWGWESGKINQGTRHQAEKLMPKTDNEDKSVSATTRPR